MTHKTYWHLAARQRMPSEYEIVSSKLHYYTERGFEVATPLGEWYRRHQSGSPLVCDDWEGFADPRETTYSSYVRLQRDEETYLDGLLAAIDGTEYDRRLPRAWVAVLDRVVAPLRYPCHALQMLAAYVGEMAPSGKITIAALFQSADEMRRVHRLAYRLRQLQDAHPNVGRESRSTWEEDPLWQSLRETIERSLVTYDWGESFAATNLVLKPLFDEFFAVHFASLARCCGDDVLERMLRSFGGDGRWHREWSTALARTIVRGRVRNAEVLAAWVAKWRPAAVRALEAFRAVYSELLGSDADEEFERVTTALSNSHAELLRSAGVAEPQGALVAPAAAGEFVEDRT